jgi:hypothetical protein
MAKLNNPIFFNYHLVCTFSGCGGGYKIEQAESAGWTLGMILPEDRSHPDVGRCPKCKRYMMKVATAPEPPKPEKPVGWTKIPTE